MKKTNLCLLSLMVSLFLLVACGSDSSKYSQDAEGFAKIQEDFKSKFGADAYYTNISINYIPGTSSGSGLSYGVTVTNDPASLKMEEWVYNSYAKWNQTAEVTLEIEDGTNPAYFMYQLGGKFDLGKVGSLVEQSAKKLAEEKNLEGAVLDLAFMDTPDNESADETKINIMMKPKNGGTTFSFTYDLDGNLLDFSY